MEAPIRRIALVQAHATDDVGRNLEQASEHIRRAADAGAEIVCLQELFRTLYFPQDERPENFDMAEPLSGPTVEHLGKLAREKGVVIIAPVFEKRAAGLYHNSAVVLDADGSQAGVYRKMHIPDDPGFYEKFYFTPGDLGFSPIDTRFGRIGVLICWDQWFPEAARLLALAGAGIVFYPTAIAWLDEDSPEEHRAQQDSWLTVQRGHAIANGVFVAAVNRVGREDGLTFYGSSFVCDPQGRMLAQASEGEEELLITDLPLERIEEQRRAWPFLRDRRIDAYGELLQRYREKS